MLILAILVILLIELALFSYDKYWWSFIVFVASLAAGYYYIPEVAAYVATHNWIEVGLWYIGLGVTTATVKWFLFYFGVASRVKEARESFSVAYTAPKQPAADDGVVQVPGDVVGIPSLTKEKVAPRQLTEAELQLHKRTAFVDFVDGRLWREIMRTDQSIPNHMRRNLANDEAMVDLFTPRAKNYVERISSWILQWPIVIVATIFEDLIVKIGKHVARLLDFFMNRIARVLIGNAVKGM